MADTAGTRLSSEAELRASRHWEQQFAKNRIDSSLWTNNQIVAHHIYRLISDGGDEHWLPWFFGRYLSASTTFAKSLSICCGDGAHELVLANSGRVGFIHGFDLSEGAITQAVSAFQRAGYSDASYRFEVANADNLHAIGEFDLMLSTGALHHVTNLEHLLSRLTEMLAPEGYFLVLEYVGPNRFQWRDRQVRMINGILQQLDARFLRNNQLAELAPPALEEFLAIDPSEAVRSEDILPLLQEHFTIEYLRNFNGTIMHPLYPLLNGQLTNAGAADFDSIVRLILLLEDQMIRENVLTSDFVFAICRSKKSRRSTPERYVAYIDVFDASVVAGWAANITDPSKTVELDLYLEDEWQARIRCDRFRQDLEQAGFGDGRKAFEYRLSDSRKPLHGGHVKLKIAGSDQTIASAVCRVK